MRRADYDFGTQLGKGSFGTVFKIRRKSDRRTFVCKEIQLQSMSEKDREEANHEVRVLKKVSAGSKYIVQYEDSFVEAKNMYIIMEFCEHGDLSQYLKAQKNKHVEESVVWKFLIQIGIGLHWLHSQRILHRDIKPLNVFLTSIDEVRLGDLGVARVLSHNTSFAKTFVGTPYYLSPELCEEKPYNEKSDVWAYGCVVYEMCALKHPFDARNHAALLIKILRGMYPPVPAHFSPELITLIDDCMRRKVDLRPTLTTLFEGNAVKSWIQTLGLSLDPSDNAPPARAGSSGEALARERRQRVAAASGRSGPANSSGQASKPIASAKPVQRASSKPLVAAAKPVPERPGRSGPGFEPHVRAAPAAKVAVGVPGGVPARRRSNAEAPPGRGRTRAGAQRLDEKQAPAKSVVICAPASSNAPLVIRNAPGRGGGAVPGRRSPEGAQRVKLPGSSRDPAEERRRAAREVADLPDVISVQDPKRRNVISVQEMQQGRLAPQLFAVEPSAVDSPVVPSSSSRDDSLDAGTLSPREILSRAVGRDEEEAREQREFLSRALDSHRGPLETEAQEQRHFLSQAVEEAPDQQPLDDLTICSARPLDTESQEQRDVLSQAAEQDPDEQFDDLTILPQRPPPRAPPHAPPRPPPAQAGRLASSSASPEVDHEQLEAADNPHARPMDVGITEEADRGDRPIKSEPQSLALHASAEMTGCSVFDNSAGKESLWYTKDDASEFADTRDDDSTFANTRDDASSPEPSSPGALGPEVVMGWDVVGGGDVNSTRPSTAEGADSFGESVDRGETPELQLTAKFNSDGLLCDDLWAGHAQDGPDAVPVAVQDDSPEGKLAMLETPQETTLVAAAPVQQDPVRARREKELCKLNQKIERITADVVNGLDEAARVVWEDLYGLFKANMTADSPDEDQSELEAFIFEQLPTESTELIWKVYQVLALEQEIDRCQRELDS